MTRPPRFEQCLKDLLADPRSDERALRRCLRRLPPVGIAETVVLRETGLRLINDVSVEATWPLGRLRRLAMTLAERGDPVTRAGLFVVGREIELAGAAPAGTPAQVLNYRGCVLAEYEQLHPAVDHFSAALGADPGFVPALVNRALSAMELGRTLDARSDAAEALERGRDYPPARFADRLVRTLLPLAERSPLPVSLLAAEHGVLDLLRTYDRAARPLEPRDASPWDEEAITPPPRPPASADAAEHNHYGVVNGRIGRYTEAIHAFESALARDPHFARARFNLAKAHQMAGDHERALAELRGKNLPRREACTVRARSLRALWRIDEARAQDAKADGLERRQRRTSAPPGLPDLSDLLRAVAREPVGLEPWSPERIRSALAQLTRMSARGRHGEAMQLLVRMAQRPAPTPGLQARLHERQAVALAGLGRAARAREQYSAALALLPEGCDEDLRSRCFEGRAACAADGAGKAGKTGTAGKTGKGGKARTDDLHAALTSALRASDRAAEARLRSLLGRAAQASGHPHAAAAWYRSVLVPAREAEDWQTELDALRRCAELADRLGHADRSRTYGDELSRARHRAGDLALCVDEDPEAVVQASRRTLLACAPARPAAVGSSSRELERLLDHADGLRGAQRRPADALACYYPALAVCLQREDPGETERCLTGMGTAYEGLAGEAALRALTELARALGEDGRADTLRSASGTLSDAAGVMTDGEAGELTECARAAFRWALALGSRRGDQVAQAAAVSNLAMTEARLGNLDTASRYERWALDVHLRAGADDRARIGLGHLVRIAERLGDEEGAARLRRRREELDQRGEL
ncbi:tetratricopeptide repeat protein [Streptomyces sp. NPDC002209]|uniref:tetratricopeptide repeat protein n=1 Tax=Streptomyces sp. NPDC002209 TaxID=3364638 RepID=UPI0036D09B6A